MTLAELDAVEGLLRAYHDDAETLVLLDIVDATPKLVAEVRRLRDVVDQQRFGSRVGDSPEYPCVRHGAESCPSCLAYLLGDLRAALGQEVKS